MSGVPLLSPRRQNNFPDRTPIKTSVNSKNNVEPNVPNVIFDPNLQRRYAKGRYLGKGGFAHVYSCIDITNCTFSSDSLFAHVHKPNVCGNAYAIKVVPKSKLVKERARVKLESEIAIHKTLDSKYVVKFYSNFQDEENIYMILELCENGNLSDMLRKMRRFTESDSKYIINELLNGCLYLHRNNVLHRDLKLGNIFLTSANCLKIGDFGLAARLIDGNDKRKTVCGTPNYIAPEVLDEKGNGHSFPVDVWSLGVITYTLVVGHPPFEDCDVKSTYSRIRNLSYSFPNDLETSFEFRTFVQSTLVLDPTRRANFEQLQVHPWLTESSGPSRSVHFNSYNNHCGQSPMRSTIETPKTLNRCRMETDLIQSTPKTPISSIHNRHHNHTPQSNRNNENTPLYNKSARSGGHSDMNDLESFLVFKELDCPVVLRVIDLRSKYGISYLLSDGSYGACYNDGSRILINPFESDFHQNYFYEFISRPDRKVKAVEDDINKEYDKAIEPDLRKKTILIRQFRDSFKKNIEKPESKLVNTYLFRNSVVTEHVKRCQKCMSAHAQFSSKHMIRSWWICDKGNFYFKLSHKWYQLVITNCHNHNATNNSLIDLFVNVHENKLIIVSGSNYNDTRLYSLDDLKKNRINLGSYVEIVKASVKALIEEEAKCV